MVTIPREWSKEQVYEALDQIALETFGPDFELKEWQKEATTNLLCGKDVLLTAPTGSGKSLPFYLYALARPLQTVLVVSPLKMLEKDMVRKLKDVGLEAVALNADTEYETQREGRDIWKECAEGSYRVILCSPEQLASPRMNWLLDQKSFQQRCQLVAIDEAHLIPIWGGKVDGRVFRRAFNGIGTLRSRLQSSRTVFLALSATLMPGNPTKVVEESLGLHGPTYHRIKLNCERTNLHIVLRKIKSSLSSGVFGELDWLLSEVLDPQTTNKTPPLIPKAIIYVDNIPRGWNIAQYLQRMLPPELKAQGDSIIRHMHAATCPKCKDEILEEFSKPGDTNLRIVVTTDVFGCGIDISDIARVVNYGTPRNFAAGYQRVGRAGRGLAEGWGYIYVNPLLWDNVEAELGINGRTKSKRVRRSKKSTAEDEEGIKCCPDFRQLLVAHLERNCLSRTINHLYHTTPENGRDKCGRCSGCVDDNVPEPVASEPLAKKARKGRPSWLLRARTRGLGHVRKATSNRAHQGITKVVARAFLSLPVDYSRPFDSPDDFLPPETITLIVKYLRDLETAEQVHRIVGNEWSYWDSHGASLVAGILQVRDTFLKEIQETRLEEQAKRQVRAAKDILEEGDSEFEDHGDEESEDEGVEEMDIDQEHSQLEVRPVPRLVIRIPARPSRRG